MTQQIATDALVDSIAAQAVGKDRPKYLRLADAFVECVVSGRFLPGQRVPTEAELTQKLPVSMGTVQKAMSKLASDGFVVRNRKTGTFINDRLSQVNEVFVYRFKDPASGKIMLPFVRTMAVELDEQEGAWSEVLSVARTVRIDRLVWFDQQPPAFSSIYFKPEHGEQFLSMPLETMHGRSLHRSLIERFNLPSIRMEHKFGCRILSDQACDALMLKPGSYGTVWDITDFTFGDTPFLFQRYQLSPDHPPVEIAESHNH